jgi:hypothetical protein
MTITKDPMDQLGQEFCQKNLAFLVSFGKWMVVLNQVDNVHDERTDQI